MSCFYIQAYKLWLKENNDMDIRLPGLSKYTDEQLFFINTAQVCISLNNACYNISAFTEGTITSTVFAHPWSTQCNVEEKNAIRLSSTLIVFL